MEDAPAHRVGRDLFAGKTHLISWWERIWYDYEIDIMEKKERENMIMKLIFCKNSAIELAVAATSTAPSARSYASAIPTTHTCEYYCWVVFSFCSSCNLALNLEPDLVAFWKVNNKPATQEVIFFSAWSFSTQLIAFCCYWRWLVLQRLEIVGLVVDCSDWPHILFYPRSSFTGGEIQRQCVCQMNPAQGKFSFLSFIFY